jgi:hypothetical protein
MKRIARQLLARLLLLIGAVALATAPATASAQSGATRFDQSALDAMLAPIALYPDALLSHVLMAATYPEEVAEAANWLRARPGLSGDAAVRTSEQWDWEPSVRSLLAFPMVLETMGSHLRWTEDVGQAFLGQREAVLDTIQALRRRAYEAGTLRSNEAVRVVQTVGGIVVEQVAPETVHVPYYDPRVAYGGWWWPSTPPVYWPRWHGYYDPLPRGRYLAWGPGIHVSSGFFFGGFAWTRREVHIVHTRPYYYPRHYVERRVVPGRGPVVVHREAVPGVWRHHDWRKDRDGRDWRRADRDDDRRDARRGDRDDDRRDWRRGDSDGGPREARRGDRDDDRRDGRQWDRDGDGRRDGRSSVTRTDVAPRESRSGYGSAAPNQPREYRTRPVPDRDAERGPDGRNRSDARGSGRNERPEGREGRGVPREAPRSMERAAPRVERPVPAQARAPQAREEFQSREVRRQRGRDLD